MKVKQLGRNQTELHMGERIVVLFSYETPVAARIGAKYYKVNESYSSTTSRHVNAWLEDVKFVPMDGDDLVESLLKSISNTNNQKEKL